MSKIKLRFQDYVNNKELSIIIDCTVQQMGVGGLLMYNLGMDTVLRLEM